MEYVVLCAHTHVGVYIVFVHIYMYVYIYIFFFILFSIMVYYKILTIVPCVIQ